ncbi:MAG: hypothetical protein J2P32_13030, partial [Actinobacteria bacterium]|nr:hypothetical protein [Actinomycetota bacterium]
FLSNLFNLLGIGGQQGGQSSGSSGNNSGGSSGSGGQTGGQSDLADQIGQLTQSFVTDLLKLVGAGGSGSGNGSSGGSGDGSQQSGGSSQQTGTGGGSDLGDQIGGLVNDFVTSLLKLVGAGGQQGGQSGGGSGAGSTGQSGQGGDQLASFGGQDQAQGVAGRMGHQRAGSAMNRASGESGSGLDQQRRRNVKQVLGGVVDLTSGLVTAVAGRRAGAQARQALGGLAQDVSDAIAATNRLDSRGRGMSGATTTPSTGGTGHAGGQPATGPDATSASPSCQDSAGCASTNQALSRQPKAAPARGPPAHHATQPTTNKSAAKHPKKPPLPKGISSAQAANAATIVKVGKRMGIPKRGLQVALAASLEESGLHNLHHGDHDSLGLFQQRPSQSWGTPHQVLNPTHAATQFFNHLKKVPGWAKMSITKAAQAVQRSATPSAYAKFAHKAAALVDHVLGSGNTGKATKPTPKSGTEPITQPVSQPQPTPAPATSGTSGTGSAGAPATQSGQADLGGSIRQLVGNFVTDLLNLLGIGGQQNGQSGSTGGSTSASQGSGQQGSQQGSQGIDLGESISELTNEFESGLLHLVGTAKPGNGSSGGGSGSTDQSDQRHGGGAGGLVGSILGSVSDLTGGILGSLPGKIGKALSGHQQQSGHQQSGRRPQPDPEQGDLADSVTKLTQNFVSSLLDVLGVGGGQ